MSLCFFSWVFNGFLVDCHFSLTLRGPSQGDVVFSCFFLGSRRFEPNPSRYPLGPLLFLQQTKPTNDLGKLWVYRSEDSFTFRHHPQ